MHHPIIVRRTQTGHSLHMHTGAEVHRMYGSDQNKARQFAMALHIAIKDTVRAVQRAAA